MTAYFRKCPFYPFLFAAYPTLYLYSQNWREANFADLPRPLFVSTASLCAVWALMRAIMRDSARASLATLLVSVLFFTAPFYSQIPVQVPVVWLAAVIAVGVMWRTRPDVTSLSPMLNVAVLVLVGYAGVEGIRGAANSGTETVAPAKGMMIPTDIVLEPVADPPNVYFILVDGYGRSDVLRTMYDYDNRFFLEFLREQGFYVAENAPGNHTRTLAALSSLMNFVEIARYTKDQGFIAAKNVGLFRSYVRNNRVVALFQNAGYRTSYLVSGAEAYNRIGAEDYVDAGVRTSEFESMLMSFTPIPVVQELIGARTLYGLHRRSHQTILNHLTDYAKRDDGPQFVFAHILSPHPPFVFDAEGNAIEPDYPFQVLDGDSIVGRHITREEYVQKYRDQIAYITPRLQEAIAEVRAADPGAIVVVQSDHGPGSEMSWRGVGKTNIYERGTVLNALYFPGEPEVTLYDTLSPVNTFPLIFNGYFGTDIPLLEDWTFYAPQNTPFFFGRILPNADKARRIAAGEFDDGKESP